MYYQDIAKILSYYFKGFTLMLAVPFVLAFYYEYYADPASHPQPHTTLSFLFSMAVCLGIGYLLQLLGRHASGLLYRREGLAAVVLIWFCTPLVSALPFYFSGTLEDPFQAYFEAASGFTTTGATVMQAKRYDAETGEEVRIVKSFCGVRPTVYNYYGTIKPVVDPQTGEALYKGIEAVSKALLFWRSFTQWLGGMGIIVLFVAILPALGVGGKMLFQAEVPGPIKDSLTPRIKETAINLWKIYAGISLLEVVILMISHSDIGLYDALTITFSTVSTGGFTVKNESIGFYNSALVEWITLIFMTAGGINFALYYYSLKGKFYRIYEPEFFLYIVLLLLGGLAITALIWGTASVELNGNFTGLYGFGEAFRTAFYQLVSVQTTTGFATVDYDIWPYSAQVLMLIAMYLGGMSGSTAGGIKIMRHLMLFRIVQYKVESLFRPETVRKFRVGRQEVSDQVSILVLCFFAIVIAFSAVGTLFFVIDGLDPETALSLTALLINNIGIGFRMSAPNESMAFLSDFALVVSSFLMIVGRLEFFAVLAILVPAFWKQRG